MTRAAMGLVWLIALAVAGCAGASGKDDRFVEIPGVGATRVDVPRPTTPGGAVCTPSMVTDQTVPERVAALRRIGLFTDRSGVTDATLGAEVQAAIESDWGDQVPTDDPLMDLLVADRDPTRVWWHDLEADVSDGNEVYVDTLREWAAISESAFAPTDIAETWASDTGPVTVTFLRDGIQQELRPSYIEDWIDPLIASSINELIAPSGRRFEFVQAFDQTAFVMALTKDERTALETRGWCFE